MFEGVRLTHPDRILYPGTQLTKLDVARYYAAIQDWVLPELAAPAVDLGALARGRQEDAFTKSTSATRRRRRSGGSTSTAGEEPEIYPYIEDLPGLVGAGADGRARNPSLGLAGREARIARPGDHRSRPR